MTDLENYKKLFVHTKMRVNKFYIMITIFIIIIFIVTLNSIYYENIYQIDGIGTKDGYIKTVVPKEDIEKIVFQSDMIIDGKKYGYRVIRFSQLTQLGNSFYQEIYIKVNKNIQENQYISFKVPVEKIKFYKLIINKVRGKV